VVSLSFPGVSILIPTIHFFKRSYLVFAGDKFWLGKLLEHPEIMTHGETLDGLEQNIKEAFLLMAMDDVSEQYETKMIAI